LRLHRSGNFVRLVHHVTGRFSVTECNFRCNLNR
jgi:hypothetical protein